GRAGRAAPRRGRAGMAGLRPLSGLAPGADHGPGRLSGGGQRRLGFAGGGVGRRAMVVADEPTAELDSASADRVLAAVHDLTAEGMAFILASHDRRGTDAADHPLPLEHGRGAEAWGTGGWTAAGGPSDCGGGPGRGR